MKKNILLVGILILGTMGAGCATTSVSSDYDRSADFSKLKTFGWAVDPKPTGDIRFDDPDLREAIKNSVEAELQAKGLQKAASGQPDLLLKYYITTEKKSQFVGGNPPTFNSRGVWSGATGATPYGGLETMTLHYEEGTFVLDMLDPRSGGILWRGTLEGMVDPSGTPAKRIARTPVAIAKVLKNFPPGKESK